MALLIDGYNVLYANGILRSGVGPTTLERARRALLNFLALRLEAPQRQRTTVVFDAKHPPPDAPTCTTHHEITVLFAREYDEADDLIEQFIRRESTPHKLTVVSSDRRIQRAARRRRIRAVASDHWYETLLNQVPGGPQEVATAEKPAEPRSEAEIEAWLRAFSDPKFENARADSSQPRKSHALPDTDSADAASSNEIFNPFPDDYCDDLFESDDD